MYRIFFILTHTISHIKPTFANYPPVPALPAHTAEPPYWMKSRSELFKKDPPVKRKVSGNSREVISYLVLPQQPTAGNNFLFPSSDDVYLLGTAGPQ